MSTPNPAVAPAPRNLDNDFPIIGPDDEWELDVALSELAWVNDLPCALIEAAP